MSNSSAPKESALTPTGVEGLDDILQGGLPRDRLYLIEGNPGAGKTTIALQFLLAGAAMGERGLYVSLSETKEELEEVARSHDWSLETIEIQELVATEDQLDPENQFAMFQPSELELAATTKLILQTIEALKVQRVVIDSLSEMRLLAQSPLRYRRQILALKQFFAGRKCTVLMLDDNTSQAGDVQLASIAHGVISLQQLSPEYGAERRRLCITKLRGRRYRGGNHDFIIERGGVRIFPRLVASEHRGSHVHSLLKSGVEELDSLMGGGIAPGSSVLFVGPAGSGKSTLSAQYIKAVTDRGDRAAIFAFEERVEAILHRAAGIGIDLQPALDRGTLVIRSVDPAELSPGEFAAAVRREAEGYDGMKGASVVAIDSLNGYLQAMPEERFLLIQLHELLTYLGHKGVVTFLIVAQHGLVGSGLETPIDSTYIADAIILLRYFEHEGSVKQIIAVMKNRWGAHEKTLRELRITAEGIRIGEPLRAMKGLLTGNPISA